MNLTARWDEYAYSSQCEVLNETNKIIRPNERFLHKLDKKSYAGESFLTLFFAEKLYSEAKIQTSALENKKQSKHLKLKVFRPFINLTYST